MSKHILQINFKYDMTTTEYKKAVAPAADPIARFNGLLWKVWIINEKEKEAGGICLFEDANSAKAYIKGDIVTGIASNPKFSDLRVKQFDVMEAESAITRAPLHMETRA